KSVRECELLIIPLLRDRESLRQMLRVLGFGERLKLSLRDRHVLFELRQAVDTNDRRVDREIQTVSQIRLGRAGVLDSARRENLHSENCHSPLASNRKDGLDEAIFV